MRGNRLLVIIGAIFLAFVVLGRLGGIYVDWLWFQSVGYESVFATAIIAQIVLFLVSAVAFFAVFTGNALLAVRIASANEPPPIFIIPDSRTYSNRMIRVIAITVGLLLALLVGAGTSGSWPAVLRFLNPTPFGTTDPLFNQDVSFFVFTLPMYYILQSWFSGTLMLTFLACLVIYGVKIILPRLRALQTGDLQSITRELDIGSGGKAHLSILLALVVIGMAVANWLDIYELVFSPGGLVYGAGYADVNARWPALWVLVVITLLLAVLILLNIRRRGYRLLVIGFGVWLVISLIGVELYPSVIQRLEVQPSELDKERPYIEYNIAMTNKAYALDRIAETEYPAEEMVTAAEVAANPGTINNIRLWDPQPLLDTYNQIQAIRLYYGFRDIDVDRYMVNGQYRQVMLGARELTPANLPAQSQTWINQRLQFTHGYGVAVSPINEVTPEGLPRFFLNDVPPRGVIPLSRPEIYFGEATDNYVIVKTTAPEFDYPQGDDNVFVTYEGNAGVDVGSFLNRVLFAWQFGDANILLAGAITPESKILYYRNIADRAARVAPFLGFDSDPYVVVEDGRLYWIIDAYTYTDRYPYSQPVSLQQGSLNYIRNSVKVVIDAYEGNMRFYVADAEDPLIQTYAKIFPSLFVPMDEMPEALRAHVRYPEDLFRIQADLYRTYHMRDPRVFYNGEDVWATPSEIYADQQVPMAPYYVMMRLPGETHEEFMLILPYTPPNRNNMITWLAARSDGDKYGQLVAFRYPKDKLIFGPMQIESRIDQDTRISEQLTLWNQAGSRVIRGNLIVIPIGASNLYVEPIYIQAEQSRLPEMKRVIMASGNRVVMMPTVDESLTALLTGAETPPPVAEVEPPAEPGEPTLPPGGEQPQLSESARQLLDRYTRLREEMDALEEDLRRLLEQLEGGQQGVPPPTASN